MMTTVVMAIMLMLVPGSAAGNVNAKSSDDGTIDPDRCFRAGKDDGRNSEFSRSEFDNCGSSYQHGFMKDCVSVERNTIDVCNTGEDG